MLKKIKFKFTYFFQEILVFNVSSLHFRAKTLATIIACNKNYNEAELKILKDISLEIYPNDKNRASMLEEVTIYYVKKVLSDRDKLNLDKLILNINTLVTNTPRFRKKILTDSLIFFTICSKDSKSSIMQFRVL